MTPTGNHDLRDASARGVINNVGSAIADGHSQFQIGNNYKTYNHCNIANDSPASGSSIPAKPCRVIPFPRNEDVVSRNAIFSDLERLLPPSSGFQSAALWGLGGSG